MRYLFLLLSVATLVSCATTKITSYEYLTGTRGYNLTIKVTKDSITISETKGFSSGPIPATSAALDCTPTNPELWKALQNGSKDIELSKISKLESPTHRRDTDAAMFSRIVFTTADSTYKSSSFDHGQPPAMLKTVVDSLVNLKK